MCGVLTLFIWLLYPIAWGLCEGGNVITPNDEVRRIFRVKSRYDLIGIQAVFYGCLDFMAKPVFSIALIYGHWGIKPERLGLKIDDYTEKNPAEMQDGRGAHADGQANGHEHTA